MIDYRLITKINCKNIMEVSGTQSGKCFVDIVCERNCCQINPKICKSCDYKEKIWSDLK